jgi:magnesium-transporting ATPase (P-type)
VLAFGRTNGSLGQVEGAAPPPDGLEPLGLVVLAERLRLEARETVEYFRRQGVQLKIISGDAPETVAAIAADVGIGTGRTPIDGRRLPDDERELAQLVQKADVVGRISPEGKRRVLAALRDAGLHAAMIGDGVNDVPALKAARLAIAQGTGSQMAKSVADVVLVRGDFAAVPSMVLEGRKILRNLQRVAKLFVTKSAFAAFLILSVGLTSTAYPLLPRHFTLVAALTVGIPAFFLALAPSAGTFNVSGFLREVSRFALPAGTAAGLGVVSSYLFALNVLDRPLIEARTVAATVLVVVGLYLIFTLEATTPRRTAAVGALSLVLSCAYVLVIVVPPLREFFALAVPDVAVAFTAATGAGLAIAGLWLTDERFVPGRAGLSAEKQP